MPATIELSKEHIVKVAVKMVNDDVGIALMLGVWPKD